MRGGHEGLTSAGSSSREQREFAGPVGGSKLRGRGNWVAEIAWRCQGRPPTVRREPYHSGRPHLASPRSPPRIKDERLVATPTRGAASSGGGVPWPEPWVAGKVWSCRGVRTAQLQPCVRIRALPPVLTPKWVVSEFIEWLGLCRIACTQVVPLASRASRSAPMGRLGIVDPFGSGVWHCEAVVSGQRRPHLADKLVSAVEILGQLIGGQIAGRPGRPCCPKRAMIVEGENGAVWPICTLREKNMGANNRK